MKTRDALIGFLVLVVLIATFLLIKNSKKNKAVNLPLPTPSISQKISEKFQGISIPPNADRVDLSPISGEEGIGEAIRIFEKGMFKLTILADLAPAKTGYIYQAWMGNGTTFVLLGKMNSAKGGYMVDFSSTKNYPDYKNIIISLEKVLDTTPEIKILEGSFN